MTATLVEPLLLTTALGFLVQGGALQAQEKTHTAFHRTTHFVIRYRPGSRAGASVERIAVRAEEELAKICGQLGIEVGGSFQLFLYDDAQELGRVTGVSGTGGFSSGNASHIPHDNDQTRYHEMVHIVAYNLLPKAGSEKRNLFFAEGLANACLEFVHGVPVHAVAKYYKDKGALPALKEMTGPADFYAWLRARKGFNAYDVAGSYFKFLLDQYGAGRTTRYYTGASASKAFGKGIDEATLEQQWHRALDRFAMRPEVFKLLEERHASSLGRLPPDILGEPSEWRSLMQEKLVPIGDGARWTRRKGAIVGTGKVAAWSVCELGTTRYGDCVVRAIIETDSPVMIQLRLSKDNQAMVVANGTFLYRGDRPVAHTRRPLMDANRKTTDLALVRRNGRVQVWIDCYLALETDADPTPAVPGIAFHRGRDEGCAIFKDVKIRRLR